MVCCYLQVVRNDCREWQKILIRVLSSSWLITPVRPWVLTIALPPLVKEIAFIAVIVDSKAVILHLSQRFRCTRAL